MVTSEPYWDYHDITKYIEEKYKINTRDYKRKFLAKKFTTTEYCDFWHWLIDGTDLHNNSFVNIPLYYYNAPDWVQEILALYRKEFATTENQVYLRCWVEW
jgi:hypothetical protein